MWRKHNTGSPVTLSSGCIPYKTFALFPGEAAPMAELSCKTAQQILARQRVSGLHSKQYPFPEAIQTFHPLSMPSPKQDFKTAFLHFRTAACCGHAPGMLGLADMYLHGDDKSPVEQDFTYAEYWWQQAILFGDLTAFQNLLGLYAMAEGKWYPSGIIELFNAAVLGVQSEGEIAQVAPEAARVARETAQARIKDLLRQKIPPFLPSLLV